MINGVPNKHIYVEEKDWIKWIWKVIKNFQNIIKLLSPSSSFISYEDSN